MSNSVLGAAQVETPQVTPQGRKPAQKNSKSPRALALLQMSADGKVTLVPIAIRIDGKFYNAEAYKATPVPMALEAGTVYEGTRAGGSLGLFTVSGALHSLAENAPVPWIGTGFWLPAGTDAPKSGIKAESVPVGLETKDEPPRLTKSPPKDEPTTAPPAASPTSAPPPSTPSSGSAPASPPASPSKSSESSPAASDSAGSGGDGNRPRLRRGKPADPLPSDDDVPGYGKLQNASVSDKTGAGKNSTVNLAAKRVIEYVPAISDAAGPEPRSYKFEWLKGEEDERRTQMVAAAKEQVRLYVEMRAKGRIAATPPGTKPPARKQPAKPVEPILENVVMRTFDVWANNQPVMVLSADAHMPPVAARAGASAAADPDTNLQYTITLVARTDIYNNLHKLYSGVTDKFHLDVTPKVELIDAVDVDGDGSGEFLFRKISDAGSGYVVYRPTADSLWKMFDSLNPD